MQNVYRHNVEFRHYQPRPSITNKQTEALVNPNVDPNLDAQQQVGAESSADALNASEASSEHTDIVAPPPVTQSPRILPSVEISPENVEDAYVQFMFYCNPFISTAIDTTELRKGFRSPPKTDGKTFDTFVLFELIKKLNNKEIETWSQLVIELGVEPPDISKNQSTQKVQQFAVRLKVLAISTPSTPNSSVLIFSSELTTYTIRNGYTLFISMLSFNTVSANQMPTSRTFPLTLNPHRRL